MSFLTDTDVNKRKDNLFAAFESTPTLDTLVFVLRSENAEIQYIATYAAAHPGVVGIGGAWDPVRTGDDGVLTNSNKTLTFTVPIETGSSVGTVAANPQIVGPVCWEIVLQSLGSGFGSVGEFLGDLFLYDKNAASGGSSFSGVNIAFVPGNYFLSAFSANDVLGFIAYDPQSMDVYVNGVFSQTLNWGGSSVIPMASGGAPI